MNESTYLNMVHTTLWNWADDHCVELLDGVPTKSGPPVLKRELADKNVLRPVNAIWVSPVASQAAAIAAEPDFTWLSNGLRDKYGIEPVASSPAKGLLW